ncbi:SusF/SusE family outer membrane protein [Olivibacter sitiensis]|uniref:SusF/SusE family outer membrane protein n=1 Tax=Olivibacter sitiensis TaxID=376470 RepID=UPI00040B8910|nr:SusF/SusE family outer membrane protein [Olivibacter sitiensis]
MKTNQRFLNLRLLAALFVGVLFAALGGCAKSDFIVLQKADQPLAIQADTNTVTLYQKLKRANALRLDWTTGSNQGTGSAISYILQIDKSGNEFKQARDFSLGKQVYSKVFTIEELNNLLIYELNLPTEQESEIEARVVASFTSDKLAAEISTPVSVKVTPYKKVAETVFILGSATPAGNALHLATPLNRNAQDETVFSYRGRLEPGNYYFATTQDAQTATYFYKGSEEDRIVARETSGGNAFTIQEAATYSITLDLVTLDITTLKIDEPAHTQLWVFGSATPKGWVIDDPDEMERDEEDPYIFRYSGVLQVGELKIPTETGNFDQDYYMPPNEAGNINNPEVILVPNGGPDWKWQITEAGPYQIVLDLRQMRITFTKVSLYAQLWMVGDAAPAGWNIDSPTPMTLNPNDPNEFIYEGPLNVGEFKLPVATGNWSTDFFMPAVNHPPLTDTRAALVPGGDPDYKWYIAQAGTYKIVLNQLLGTIIIERK